MKLILGALVFLFSGAAFANIKPFDCYSLSMYVIQSHEILAAGGKPTPIVSKSDEMKELSYWIVQLLKKNLAAADGERDSDVLARNFMGFCAEARGNTQLMLNSMRNIRDGKGPNGEGEAKPENPHSDIESGPAKKYEEMDI